MNLIIIFQIGECVNPYSVESMKEGLRKVLLNRTNLDATKILQFVSDNFLLPKCFAKTLLDH